eukprot:CAMPEP_0194038004 /NCGR_PEP_ID=MMETSP0009_2-20130614/10281_1 /TAXON_ID=210454 /ORGANISM="Grammatophora oceanica, Strain CCMP 410" /LENGTH=102 /DNA_ID=CAMNT_0038680357 /DNA_START=109 /DNA_END=417 /DNA_ORIENTATION=+
MTPSSSSAAPKSSSTVSPPVSPLTTFFSRSGSSTWLGGASNSSSCSLADLAPPPTSPGVYSSPATRQSSAMLRKMGSYSQFDGPAAVHQEKQEIVAFSMLQM